MLLAHLSDPHLRTDALAGEPAQRLHAALGRILGIDPRPDAVVITGDLVEHDHPGAYAHLRDLLDAVPIPVRLVAGNHDDRAALLDAFAGTGHLAGGTSTRYVVEHDQASIVVLDSGGAGAQGGHLGAEEGVAEVGALAGRMHPCFVRTCETPALGASPWTAGAACLTGARVETMELRRRSCSENVRQARAVDGVGRRRSEESVLRSPMVPGRGSRPRAPRAGLVRL